MAETKKKQGEEVELAEQLAKESNGEKRIEVVQVRVGDLVDMDGNPRKITAKKKKELQRSFEQFGDFGILVVDENLRIISGHQRADAMKVVYGEDHLAWAKKLVGYSEPELKAINIKANVHAGDWDMDKLAAWTSDLQVDLGLDLPQTDANERTMKQMELIRYEKYDYVMIVCRNEIDYLNLVRSLGIEDAKITISKTAKNERKIRCRAIWYDQMKSQIVPKKTSNDDKK